MKPSYSRLLPCLLGALGAAVATPSLAQVDAGSLLNQQQRQSIPQTNTGKSAADPLPTVRPAYKGDDSIRVKVTAFRFTGAEGLMAENELQALAASLVGKEVGFNQLQELADTITDRLRARGFLLARAYLPQQDITQGVIEIALLEGKLQGGPAAYQVTPLAPERLRLDPNRVQGVLEANSPSDRPLVQADVERALLLVNDLPGVVARGRLEPGETPGTSRMVVEVDEGPLVSGQVWADNFGNRNTGTYQISGAVALNDALGIGDQALVAATHSQGLNLLRGSYSLPLGSQGLRLGTQLSALRYEIQRDPGKALDLHGSSETAQVSLAYPFIRSRNHNLSGQLSYAHKALEDNWSAGKLRDKRIDAWSFGLTGDWRDTLGSYSVNSWGVGVTSGKLDLSRVANDAATDAATYRTAGRYEKLTWNLSRIQGLPNFLSIYGALSGQMAGKNLDSSEQFILGGPNGIRAYPVSEGMGDSGWLANLELRYDLPGGSSLGNWQFATFLDTGGVEVRNDPKGIAPTNASRKNSYNLSGAGISATLSKTASHSIRLVWAHTLGSNPGRSLTGKNADDRHDSSRFWLQANIWF